MIRLLIVLLTLAAACGPGLDVARTLGGAPPVTGCTARASRCEGRTPMVCSRTGRDWEASPPCTFACAVGPDGAYCTAAPEPATTIPSGVTP